MSKAQARMEAEVVAGAAGATLDALDGVMQQLLAEHEGLLALAVEHRRAISQADLPAMDACMSRQQALFARITELEIRRQGLVQTLRTQAGESAKALAGAAGSTTARVTITVIAQRAAEPIRSRLTEAGKKLREVLNRLHGEHAAIREAAETLSSHMEGVMRQVCRQLSHAGTYGPRAAIDTRTQVVSALDVRS